MRSELTKYEGSYNAEGGRHHRRISVEPEASPTVHPPLPNSHAIPRPPATASVLFPNRNLPLHVRQSHTHLPASVRTMPSRALPQARSPSPGPPPRCFPAGAYKGGDRRARSLVRQVAPRSPAGSLVRSLVIMPVTPDAARMPGGPPPVPEVPPLDNLYGAYLIGTFVSLVLYGLSLHQLFRYVRLHKSDTAFIRILVGFVMTLETIHVALVVHTCYGCRIYFYLVTNYAHPEKLIHSEWSLEITPSFTAFVSLTAQIFFARRVSLIGWRYKIVAAIAMVALLAHVAFSLAITIITATKTHNLSGFDTLHADWIFPAVGVSATLGDLLLSGSIIIAVRRSRSHHLNTQSENHFDVAVLYLINSGLLTGVFNAIPTITAAMYPQTFIWAAFSLVATRLYANTLLSVLNSRKLAISRGLEIFHATAYVHHNIIARANHLAAVERWNAPDVSEPSPAKIDISVSADVETDGPHDDKGLDGDHKRFSADSGLGLA